MKWAYFLAAAAVLATLTSGASIEKDDHVRDNPEMRQFWWLGNLGDRIKDALQKVGDKIKETANNIRDHLNNGFGRVKDFFSNTSNKIVDTNAKAQECYEVFKKQLKAATSQEKYEKEKDYAAFVDSVVESADKTAAEFEKNVTKETKDAKPQSFGQDVLQYMRTVKDLAAARVRCTVNAYKDAFNNPRGVTTVGSIIEEATTDGRRIEEATTEAVIIEEATTEAVIIEEATTDAVIIEEATTEAVIIEEATTEAIIIEEATTEAVIIEELTTAVEDTATNELDSTPVENLQTEFAELSTAAGSEIAVDNSDAPSEVAENADAVTIGA